MHFQLEDVQLKETPTPDGGVRITAMATASLVRAERPVCPHPRSECRPVRGGEKCTGCGMFIPNGEW